MTKQINKQCFVPLVPWTIYYKVHLCQHFNLKLDFNFQTKFHIFCIYYSLDHIIE